MGRGKSTDGSIDELGVLITASYGLPNEWRDDASCRGWHEAPTPWHFSPGTPSLRRIRSDEQVAFALIIFLGALQSIPQQVYEAAGIDGATTWMRFRDQTLPAMRHVIALVLLVTTITTIGSFLMILILTNGDPAYATETIALHAYHQAFTLFDIGYGAALSVVMLLMSFVFAVVYLRVAKGGNE